MNRLDEVQAVERNPRTEILCMLLEAAEAAREEPNAYRRAKALALIAGTMRKLYPDGALQSVELASPTSARRAKA